MDEILALIKSTKPWPRPKVRLLTFLVVIAAIALPLALWSNEQRRAERQSAERMRLARISGRRARAVQARALVLDHRNELEKLTRAEALAPKDRPTGRMMICGNTPTIRETIERLTGLLPWEEEVATIFERAAKHPFEPLPLMPPKPADRRLWPRGFMVAPGPSGMIASGDPYFVRDVGPPSVKKPD